VLSTAAFAAGVAWAVISMMAQAIQVALAMASVQELPPALVGTMSDLMFALLTIGDMPIAVMLIATAVVSLQAKAFPADRGKRGLGLRQDRRDAGGLPDRWLCGEADG
jgi:hypothetical protein